MQNNQATPIFQYSNTPPLHYSSFFAFPIGHIGLIGLIGLIIARLRIAV